MAKSKKSNKKRDKSYPPLSKLDRFIYSTIQIVSTVLVLGALYGIFDIQTHLFLKDENVLAFSGYGSVWANVPYAITVIIIFGIIISKTTSGKPLFGNKKHDYYNTTKYKFVLPVFDKRYTKRTLSKQKIIKATITVGVIIAVLVYTSIISFGSLCKRYELREDMIYKLNSKGETVEAFSYDDVKSFTPTVTLEKLGTKGLGSWHIGFRLVLSNNETITATTFIGLKDLNALHKIDMKIKDEVKQAEKHNLNRYLAQLKTLSEDEKTMLNEIYE